MGRCENVRSSRRFSMWSPPGASPLYSRARDSARRCAPRKRTKRAMRSGCCYAPCINVTRAAIPDRRRETFARVQSQYAHPEATNLRTSMRCVRVHRRPSGSRSLPCSILRPHGYPRHSELWRPRGLEPRCFTEKLDNLGHCIAVSVRSMVARDSFFLRVSIGRGAIPPPL